MNKYLRINYLTGAGLFLGSLLAYALITIPVLLYCGSLMILMKM